MDLDVIGPSDLGIAPSDDEDDDGKAGSANQNDKSRAESPAGDEGLPAAKKARFGDRKVSQSPPPKARDSPAPLQAPAPPPRIPSLPDAIVFFMR